VKDPDPVLRASLSPLWLKIFLFGSGYAGLGQICNNYIPVVISLRNGKKRYRLNYL